MHHYNFTPRDCVRCGASFKPKGNREKACSVACLLALKSLLMPSGCIEWQGSRQKFGYGDFRRGGVAYRAHRAAWELVHGPIPEGHVLRHKCDNPPCVNVDHLEVGSQADNVRDMVERGRATFGERQTGAKLSKEDVAEIRSRLIGAKRGIVTALGIEFGVSHTVISRIKGGTRWAHLLQTSNH